MKKRILDLLTCPFCDGNLNLRSFIEEGCEIKEGLLVCSCRNWFPIINFVPRFLLGEYRGDYKDFIENHNLTYLSEETQNSSHVDSQENQVQKSFSSKWASQPSWGIDGETKAFMREWIFEKYGWGDMQGLEDSLKNRKRILEVGTGLGREASDFCNVCKDGEVFGVDLSDAVEAAYINTRQYQNIHIIQADLMRLPFMKGAFDFIFGEGVLHHTPETKRAFEVLLDHLAPRGEMAIYVYKKKGPIREFCDDFIRQFTTKLSDAECWEFSKKMAILGEVLSDLNTEFEIPEDIPVLEIKAGKYNLQRFFYYHIFKCFWNDRFTMDENNLINFDWYHPENAHRHTPEEVKSWFQKAELRIIHFDISESGITARGLRASK